ncbi:hypothetical protein ACH0C8_15895, partial [Acetobacter lovaniensis]|uniref:hypothetical protein n=1 Tax=Acetobacter lovaniensis TaxID=104100 RepID=UPI00376F9F33
AVVADAPAVVRALDDKNVAGYGLIEDINGNPALMLRVDVARDIYAQGQSSIQLFLVLLSVVGLIFVAATIMLLERTVISRLLRLETDVNE